MDVETIEIITKNLCWVIAVIFVWAYSYAKENYYENRLTILLPVLAFLAYVICAYIGISAPQLVH